MDSHPVFDLDTPRPEADPRFPSSLILHPSTGELLGARYLGACQEIHALDPHFATVPPRLTELSDGDPAQMCCDATAQRWVVDFTPDRDPGATCHSDHIAEALRSRGADVEYLLNETEGHWFINPDSNIELYGTLEHFLARHLGGRSSTTS
ncbi:hypothetical protein AB0H42_15080 [Nocardia sp. NPDC050799]|uniref:hypothetical protein n=1 Tax=Nocardia sp. NPDC050799 TaxID=3154842 RepID=UPI0033CE3EB1